MPREMHPIQNRGEINKKNWKKKIIKSKKTKKMKNKIWIMLNKKNKKFKKWK
jgi:hypothetical protein